MEAVKGQQNKLIKFSTEFFGLKLQDKFLHFLSNLNLFLLFYKAKIPQFLANHKNPVKFPGL